MEYVHCIPNILSFLMSFRIFVFFLIPYFFTKFFSRYRLKRNFVKKTKIFTKWFFLIAGNPKNRWDILIKINISCQGIVIVLEKLKGVIIVYVSRLKSRLARTVFLMPYLCNYKINLFKFEVWSLAKLQVKLLVLLYLIYYI